MEGRDLLEQQRVRVGVQVLSCPGSNDCSNVEGGPFHVLVLPDPDDRPSQGEQMSISLTIPLHVARKFRCPPRGVVRG